jgi:hypothetical protein
MKNQYEVSFQYLSTNTGHRRPPRINMAIPQPVLVANAWARIKNAPKQKIAIPM